MARLKKGNAFSFSGKLGKIVGVHSLRGDYLRSAPKKERKVHTVAQIAQQAKFAFAMKYAKGMQPIFEIGLKNDADGKILLNHSVSLLFSTAIHGDYPHFQLDYSEVLASAGKLPNARSIVAELQDDKIIFNWNDNSKMGKAKSTDRVFLAAYCEEIDTCECSLGSATRSAKTASLSIRNFIGKEVHTWVGFISKKGKETSNSFYTGLLKLDTDLF